MNRNKLCLDDPGYFLILSLKGKRLRGIKIIWVVRKIPAQKQLTVKKLPQILLIHLKRFTYDLKTLVPLKIRKMIKYPLQFRMSPDWLSQRYNTKTPPYELCTVISHLGVHSTGGHYTAYISPWNTKMVTL